MSDPQYLDLDGCAALLAMSRRALRAATRRDGFPAPAGTDGVPYWADRDVLRWAARQPPPLSNRVPLRFWPDSPQPAEFLGAVRVPSRYGRDDVALRWATASGTVAVVWRPDDPIMMSLDDLLADLDVDVVVGVDPDFGIWGPSLRSRNRAPLGDVDTAGGGGVGAVPRAGGRVGDDDVEWPELAHILGQPLPYWPYPLRDPNLIAAWTPGAAAVTAPARTDLDVVPLLRMTAMFDPGHATARTLLNLVRVDQDRSTRSALQDLEIVAETVQAWTDKHQGDVVLDVAARPLVVGDTRADADEVDPLTRRIGWLELLGRDDVLSMQCVGQALAWDGGRHFPFAGVTDIDPATPPGREWIARLEPARARTAQFARLELCDTDEALIDPLTDAPVVRRDGDGRIRTAVPLRLPTTSDLAEVVLHGPVWIRTSDGTLYPAPTDHIHALSWGRSCSGARVLAVLLDRLLVDVTSEPADTTTGAVAGLIELTELPWPAGTVLTREILEAARDGRPYAHPDRPDPG